MTGAVHSVIIDTDPGVDDALALLLAAASPEIDVLAVTTVGGNVAVEQTTENARRVLAFAWPGGAPPLHRGLQAAGIHAAVIHGDDGLGGATALTRPDGAPLYPAASPLAAEDAPSAILQLAGARPGEVTLITLGPLTNVAEVLRRDPDRLRQLRRIVVMGGAFRVPGNTTPVAEYNIVADPEAAREVVHSRIPQLWVPLDVTQRCVLRAVYLEEGGTARNGGSYLRFAREITGEILRHHARGYGEAACFLHDPVAVAAVLWPELFRTEAVQVDVETGGELTYGMTVADFRPGAYRDTATPNAEVCLEVYAESLMARFLARLAEGR